MPRGVAEKGSPPPTRSREAAGQEPGWGAEFVSRCGEPGERLRGHHDRGRYWKLSRKGHWQKQVSQMRVWWFFRTQGSELSGCLVGGSRHSCWRMPGAQRGQTAWRRQGRVKREAPGLQPTMEGCGGRGWEKVGPGLEGTAAHHGKSECVLGAS